jgi:hypothetical protein
VEADVGVEFVPIYKYGGWVPGRAKSIAIESLEETKIWRLQDVKRALPSVVPLSS